MSHVTIGEKNGRFLNDIENPRIPISETLKRKDQAEKYYKQKTHNKVLNSDSRDDTTTNTITVYLINLSGVLSTSTLNS